MFLDDACFGVFMLMTWDEWSYMRLCGQEIMRLCWVTVGTHTAQVELHSTQDYCDWFCFFHDCLKLLTQFWDVIVYFVLFTKCYLVTPTCFSYLEVHVIPQQDFLFTICIAQLCWVKLGTIRTDKQFQTWLLLSNIFFCHVWVPLFQRCIYGFDV